MNTFTWLVIGHLVGDWLLQNEWMARGKKRGVFTWAGLTHCTVYTIVIMGALALSGAREKLTISMTICALTFVSHWAIDALDAARQWLRLVLQSDLEVVRLVVDQLLHVLVLALLIVFFIRG
jgi:hypothetical protein